MRKTITFVLILISLSFSQLFSHVFAQVAQVWEVTGSQGFPGIIKTDNFSVFAGGYSGPNDQAKYNITRFNVNSNQVWNYETPPPLYNPYSGQVNDIIYDNSGNVFVTGFIPVAGTSDYQTIMFNSSGGQVWTATYNGSGTFPDVARAITKDDNFIYVTGSSKGAQGNDDYVTIKYNVAGSPVNILRYNSPYNGDDAAYSIVVDSSGNMYVTGSSFRSGKGLDYNTIKYLPDGTFSWSARYNGTKDSTDVPVCMIYNNGYLYVTGYSINTGTNFDIVTIKYDLSGNPVWTRVYNGPTNSVDKPKQMKIDSFGNIYIAGSTFVNNYDFITLKYDASGNLLWAVRSGDNEIQDASSLDLDNAGNIYISGSSNAHPTIAIIKYDPHGNEKWNVHYGVVCDTNSCYKTYSNSIDVDNSGNVYISGYYLSEDFGINTPFKVIAKFKQYLTATISFLIEGFYNSNANTTITDAARTYLRSSVSPYNALDSAAGLFNPSGTMQVSYTGTSANGIPCYIVIKHRNSIETWSSNPVTFLLDTTNMYNFTTAITQAYGNNMQLKGAKWTFFSGDVNQDEAIDISDVISVFNDAGNFVSGYVASDVNGDYFVDLGDLAIAFNNSANFVSVIKP